MSDINTCIPQHLWPEILKNLPVKSLGKCRCVCKSWRELVVSPDFMAAHLKHYSKTEANSFLLYRQYRDYIPRKIDDQYTLFLDSAEEKASLKACLSFTFPFMTLVKGDKCRFLVVGSVHGLICLSDDFFQHTNLFIWNPLIHRYIVLPLPKATYWGIGPYMGALGFGYDSKRGDHKVVRLAYSDHPDWHYKTPPLVELYSVRDGTWREVSADRVVDYYISEVSWSQCFFNGAIHWVVWKMDSVIHSNWLLVFDVEEEKLEFLKLPEPLAKVSTSRLRVSGYGDRLSVLHSVAGGNGDHTHCEIWVKRDYDVETSWSKMVSVGSELGWVHCLRKNGDLLGFKQGELVSYDPKTKQTKQLGIFRGYWRSFFASAYSESLVLLDKKNGVCTYDEPQSQTRRKIGVEKHSGVA